MSTTVPPSSIRAGETISFVASAYSAEDYTLKFALNNGVDAPAITDGEADETQFNVSLLAPTKPGRYAWAEVYTKTEDSSVVYGRQGYMDVLPSLLAKATPSFAATMVTKLRAVLEMFAATDKSSVSFNGQSFTRASISEYQELLTMYEARLKAEQDAIAAASGTRRGGFIPVRFIPPQTVFPFPRC